MKKENTEYVIELISLFGFIQGQCIVLINHSEISWKVQGKESLSSNFRQILKVLNKLPHDDEILYLKEEVKSRLNYFNENYGKSRFKEWRKSFSLAKEDADDLFDEIEKWNDTLQYYILEPHFETIKETTFENMFPSSLTKELPNNIKVDLRDGFVLLGSKSSTAAAMILFRAAEGIVKNYYLQVSEHKTTRLGWNKIIIELEKTHKIKKSLANYLHYLRDKRNEAAHPGKHFGQEESERILIHLKSMLEEIN